MLFWHWIALGFGLMTAEILVPSFFFLWLGIAALAVGLIMIAVPELWWSIQWTLFAGLGVGSFFITRMLMKGKKHGQSHSHETSNLNKRGANWIGEIVVIETAIEHCNGKATVGDSIWSVTGPDMPVGTKAKVVGVDGTELKVEKAS